MSKMFKCEDGTMFPIKDVISIVTVPRTSPRIPMWRGDVPKLNDYRHWSLFDPLDWIAASMFFFQGLFKGKKWREEEKKKMEAWAQREYERAMEEYEFAMKYDAENWDREWDVKIRHQRYAIRISERDYRRLCAEMGK